jgi:hypothetical protein
LKCPLHTQIKKDKKEPSKEKAFNYSAFLKKIANNIQTEESKLEDYKEQRGEIKAANSSHGHIFWALINSQYFNHPKIYKFPLIHPKPVKVTKVKKEKNWLTATAKTLSKDYNFWRLRNLKLFKELVPGKLSLGFSKYKFNEKELLTADCRSVHVKKTSKDFIAFMENHVKPEKPDDGDDICEICQEFDYEDDDLIVKCKNCLVKVHMQCYGISLTGKDDWICHMCRARDSVSLELIKTCALCPVLSGVLKPTTTHYSKHFNFLSHLNFSKSDNLWVHVFCATHIDPSCIKNKLEMENIDLKIIEKRKFLETCSICMTNKGACIKCLSPKCRTFFHPLCSREKFLYTRNHSGFDLIGPYCDVHKTSRLRKMIEIKESQLYSDFCNFIKNFDKIDKVCPKRTADSDFSYDEKFQVFDMVDKFLARKTGKFEIVFKCNRNDSSLRAVVETSVGAPTFLDTSYVDEEFHTFRHEPLDVQDFYAKNVFEIMKQEVKILKLPLIPYNKTENEL